MIFTFDAYRKLIQLIKEKGYVVSDYQNYDNHKKSIILRHDVDNDLKKAVEMAEVENQIGVKSTYFVLLTSKFYNPLSKADRKMIKKIQEYGHDIGLHFDEANYEFDGESWDEKELCKLILTEAEILSKCIDSEVRVVSMHRPSKQTLESNLIIPNMINSYGKTFFNDFKYVSDSRMNWREDVEVIIESGKYDKLHILTHAFWYYPEEKNISEICKNYILNANFERYCLFKNGIRDLESIVDINEII